MKTHLTRITAALLSLALLLVPLSAAADVVLGDVDGNNKINTSDSRRILQAVAGITTLETDALIAADVNQDGKVNTTDARQILQFVAGIITDFEQPQMPTAGYEDQVFALINQYRTENGVSPLSYRHDAQAAADLRAKELVDSFSHTRPNGSECFTVFDENGIQYYAAGENIAMGYTTPNEAMDAWMNSSGHRANILQPLFTGVAIGVYENNGYLYWVQLFLG